MQRRDLLLASAALAAVPTPWAQTGRPIRLIVPYAPGGPLDVTARALAERVREAVQAQPFELGDGQVLALTCSVGVAVYPPLPETSRGGLPDWDQAIAAADAALLVSKRSGRNRSTLAGGDSALT